MKKVLPVLCGLGLIFVLAGCSAGSSDISEGGAVDKHDQIQKATEASVDKDAIDKSRN